MARQVVIWQTWVTAGDGRVCSLCAGLAGQLFPRGEGPYPPLHLGCRCRRVRAFEEDEEEAAP